MRHSLLELTEKQWEDLCDGCGRCCTVKLQDEDTDEIHFTNVACEFLDTDSCRCSDYSNRTTNKPECMVLDRTDLSKLSMMPFTCAYRLAYEGRELESGDTNSLKVSGKVVSEAYIHEDQLPDHIVEWISSDHE